MAPHRVAYLIILVELIGLISIIVMIQIRRIVLWFYQKKTKQITDEIVKAMMDSIQNNTHLVIKHFSPAILLKIVEDFDQRFKGSEWEEIKKDAVKRYLIPIAKKWASSPFWNRRNVAVRCFILAPSKEEEAFFLHLVEDRHFLVQSYAIIGVAQIASEEGVIKILKNMNKEPGFLFYYYRDILIHGSKEVLHIFVEEAKKQHEDTYRACLDVLAGKNLAMSLDFLKESIHDNNDDVRLKTLKALNINPLLDMEKILLTCLDDSKEDIRIEAIIGAENFATDRIVKKLEEIFMHDDSFNMRMESAKGLKKIGERGVSFLQKCSKHQDKTTYEIAQYALSFE
ncbi:MAG: hypothetical protein HY860_05580 [Chlamydiales bacterium]|nr:hypothetical protein [Chlamydiales bacterium]